MPLRSLRPPAGTASRAPRSPSGGNNAVKGIGIALLVGLCALGWYLKFQRYARRADNERIGDADHATEVGLKLVYENKLADAEAKFTESIRLVADNPRAYFERAKVRLDRGRPQEALADLDQAVKLQPDIAGATELRRRIDRTLHPGPEPR